MAYNIVAFVCIDKDDEDAEVIYDQLGASSGEQRRVLYWKLAYTFFCVSGRINPNQKHIVFTNDANPIVIKGLDIKKELISKNVEIRYLPFKEFNPHRYSNRLKNAFYKFEVLTALGEEKTGSILLDTDCLWVENMPELDKLINNNELLVYDVYSRSHDPDEKGAHGLSMRDMGNLYKRINSFYKCSTPIRYGGELIGGSSAVLKKVGKEAKSIFDHLIIEAENGNHYYFNNKWHILSGMELLGSYVYNSGKFKINHANGYIKRIWTLPEINNVNASDMDLAIWHLIGEKQSGLHLLFQQAIKPASRFWKIEPEDLKVLVGNYCGIPKRKYGRFQSYFIKRFVREQVGKVKNMARESGVVKSLLGL